MTILSVLLVDDIPENLEYLSALLTGHGFAVESATNGANALAAARLKLPDLVVSDLLMPVMDGYEFLRQWKSDAGLGTIPFIVYTATYIEPEDEQLALDMGADAFMRKPSEPEAFLEEIRRVIAGPARSAGIRQEGRAGGVSLQDRYNAVLVHKLEQKTQQLEKSNRELLREIFERGEIAQTQIAILNALPAHIALIDADGVVISVNESWRRFGVANGLRTPDLGVGQNYLSICAEANGVNSSEAPSVADGIGAVLRGESPGYVLEYPCHSATERRWFRMMVSPLHSNEARGAVVMHVDVTDRRSAELRLQESQQQYLLLLNSTAEGIYGLDLDGICTFCNPAAAYFLGYGSADELVGKRVHDLHHHSDHNGRALPIGECRIYGALRTGEPAHHDDELFFRTDGSSFPVEFWSHPIRRGSEMVGAVVAFLDVSERRNLEAQFLQSQKMEAIGRLAGGVAHDFNNCLQVVLTCNELLMERLAADSVESEYVRAIKAAGERGASLTRQLLAFSRKQLVRPQLLDLNVIVSDVQAMLRRMIGEDVRLTIEYHPDICAIEADGGQVEQLLMNLAVNSRDAMAAGGELFISTAIVERGSERAVGDFIERGPGYALLTVRDTGAGMDAETRSMMFEPFFTTKEPGKGTGLGLSTVYAIVKQSGGFIEVDSTPGAGTTFRIYLPAAREIPAKAAAPAPPASRRRGTESILLVEDEAPLLTLVSSTLRANGYTVYEAGSGQAGVALAANPELRLDLLISDVILPDISGPQVAEQLMSSQPGIRVLYISGYTDDYISNRMLLDGRTLLLEKPFSIESLLTRIRDALDDGPPSVTSRPRSP